MITLITPDYFINGLSLPNTGSGNAEYENITSLIDTLSQPYLEDLLGVTMAGDFITSIEDILETPDSVSEHWKNLLFGKTFTSRSGVGLRWVGLSSHELIEGLGNTDKRSPLANYVYVKYLQQNTSSTQAIGEVESNFENGRIVSPNSKFVNAWQEMVNWHMVLNEFLLTYITVDQYKDYFPQSEELYTNIPHVF